MRLSATGGAAEWSQDDRKRGLRKALINVEGWMDRWGDQVFAVGGITEFVQAVRKVNIKLEARNPQPRANESLSIFGQVSPSAGVVPVAIHITDPSRQARHGKNTDYTAMVNSPYKRAISHRKPAVIRPRFRIGR